MEFFAAGIKSGSSGTLSYIGVQRNRSCCRHFGAVDSGIFLLHNAIFATVTGLNLNN